MRPRNSLFTVLNKHVGELLPVVAELINDSIFPQEELDIYKKNAQQRLQVSLKKSEFCRRQTDRSVSVWPNPSPMGCIWSRTIINSCNGKTW